MVRFAFTAAGILVATSEHQFNNDAPIALHVTHDSAGLAWTGRF